MGTRSTIAIFNTKDQSYDAVYCHWDGYPEHHIPILTEDYTTAKKVRQLIAPGDISSLKTTTGWSGEKREMGPLYYMDRGDLDCQPRHIDCLEDLKDFAFHSGCEHLYTYTPRRGWKHEPILP